MLLQHLWKALQQIYDLSLISSIFLMEDGIDILIRLLQSLKANLPIRLNQNLLNYKICSYINKYFMSYLHVEKSASYELIE